MPRLRGLPRNLRRHLHTLTPLSGDFHSTLTSAERSCSRRSLEDVRKTSAVIPAAIQFPTAETDEGNHAEAPVLMEALNRTPTKFISLTRSPNQTRRHP